MNKIRLLLCCENNLLQARMSTMLLWQLELAFVEILLNQLKFFGRMEANIGRCIEMHH